MPRSAVPTRTNFKYFESLPTRWNDNDPYGHVNNAVYYFFFDTVVNNYLIKHDLLEIGQSETIGLVVETGCQYFTPLAYPDSIDVGLSIQKIGNSSVTYQLGLFAPNSDSAAGSGHFVHVYVDAQSRKPKTLTNKFRAALDPLKLG